MTPIGKRRTVIPTPIPRTDNTLPKTVVGPNPKPAQYKDVQRVNPRSTRVPVRPTGPANTVNKGIPANVSSFLAANKNGALTKGPSYADTMRTALKNAPKVTPEIQGMADMSSAIARGPVPNPLNPTGSLNGPRFGGMGMKKGGKVKVKSMASGGKVSSASSRADGCVMKGKTKGRFV